jgi:competence protein ComEC
MKNIKLFRVTIIVAILCLLAGGCTSRSQLQPGSSPTPVGNLQVNKEFQADEPSKKILKVHFIDVGQGDAILIQTPLGQNMLVDAGDNDYGSLVVNYLISQGIKDLDVVVGTHPHADHIGGLDTVLNRFPVKNIYMPKVTNTTQSFRDVLKAVENRGLKITAAKAGVDIPLDGIGCHIIAPIQNLYEDLNDYSAVIKLEYGSQSFLLTGDAGTESEGQILALKTNLKSTVLKIGHHGSYSSSGSKFLKAVAPQYAVIMVGGDNKYGHPHTQILSRLSGAGIGVYRTDQHGTIVFATDGNDMQVSFKGGK